MQGSEFKAAGNDIVSSTVNLEFNFGTPPSGFPQALNELTPNVEHLPQRQIPAADSRPSHSPPSKSAKWLRGLLSPRRQQPSFDGSFANSPEGPPVVQSLSCDADTPPLTPGSSCAPSPLSSQEDVTLSSAVDLDLRLRDPHNLTTPQVYVQSMSTSGKGLACWKPRPIKPSYSGPRGVVPGDVGTYSAEGGFKRIFNLWDDEDSIRTVGYPGGAAFELPPRNVAIDPEDIPRGDTITEGASSCKVSSDSDESEISSFEFRCHSKQGAVFAATSPAELEELIDFTDLRECIIRYPHIIYAHANEIRRVADDEQLYIITGCIKSDSWALAVFKEAMPAPYDTMLLRNITPKDTELPRFSWTQRATAEARFGSSGQVGLKDQTLFLRGFKLDFSQAFRKRTKRLPRSTTTNPSNDYNQPFDPSDTSGPEGDGADSGGGGGQQGGGRDGGPSGFKGSGSSRSGSGRNDSNPTAHGQCQDQEHNAPCASGQWTARSHWTLDSIFAHSAPYPPYDTCHPLDLINMFLLETTGADFALCHDDLWRCASRSPDAPSGVNAAISEPKIFVRNGVALLCCDSVDSERRLGGIPQISNVAYLTGEEVSLSPPQTVQLGFKAPAAPGSGNRSLMATPCYTCRIMRKASLFPSQSVGYYG